MYQASIDFLALLRQTSRGMRTESMPGLDYIVAALARTGAVRLWVNNTQPTSDLATTVWLKPAAQSWQAEGSVFLYDVATATFQPATPALWFSLLSAGSGGANFSYLPGGILYQWGTANVGTVFSTVNFPIPYSAPPNVVATVSGSVTVKAASVSAVTGAGFDAATTGAAENINWHAVGSV